MLAPNIGWAAVRVLARAGVEVVVPREQACCGALALHVGEEARARDLARENLRAFPADVDAIVTTAAGLRLRACRNTGCCSKARRTRPRRAASPHG